MTRRQVGYARRVTESAEAARRARAEARRAGMWGEKVLAGTPKPELYIDLSPTERFYAMARLCARQWLAHHPLPSRLPRSEWPGEKFDIEAERARSR